MSQTRIWLLALFLFLVPWQTRWIFHIAEIGGATWEYGTLALYATEILLWVVVLLGWKDFVRGFLRTGVWKWIVVAGVLLPFISIAWAQEPSVAFFAALHIFEAALLALVIMNVPLNTLIVLGGAFALGAVFQSLLALYQITVQWVYPSTLLGVALQDPIVPGVSVVETAGGRFLRAYGGLPHPNILGGYLTIAWFMVMALLREVRQRWLWILMLACAALITGALFLTFSRSAWLALLLGIICVKAILLFRAKNELREPVVRFRVASFVLVTLCVVGIFTFAFRDVVRGRFTGTGRLETISQEERVGGVRDALSLIRERPFVGRGIAMFTRTLREKIPGQPAWAYQPVHNAPLLAASELGVLGMLFLLAALVGLWRFFRRQWHVDAPDSWIRFAGATGAVIAIIVIATLDHYPWSLYAGNMLMAVTIGFLLNQAKDTP